MFGQLHWWLLSHNFKPWKYQKIFLEAIFFSNSRKLFFKVSTLKIFVIICGDIISSKKFPIVFQAIVIQNYSV